MRAKGIEGGVLLEFVVGTNGTFEPGTLQLVSMTSREFLDSVLEVLPRLRFYPLEVAGCKVPGLTTMPFLFGLNR